MEWALCSHGKVIEGLRPPSQVLEVPDSWPSDGVRSHAACLVARLLVELHVVALLVGTTLPVPLPFRFAPREGKERRGRRWAVGGGLRHNRSMDRQSLIDRKHEVQGQIRSLQPKAERAQREAQTRRDRVRAAKLARDLETLMMEEARLRLEIDRT